MRNENSGDFFYLIDRAGNRYVPHKKAERKGRRRYGYAIHPVGKGNDTEAAAFTEDGKTLVQEVVLHGKLVRCWPESGPQAGDSNSVGLGRKKIRGYWLCPTKMEWIAGAKLRPENERVLA
jgi:hypothetical protein